MRACVNIYKNVRSRKRSPGLYNGAPCTHCTPRTIPEFTNSFIISSSSKIAPPHPHTHTHTHTHTSASLPCACPPSHPSPAVPPCHHHQGCSRSIRHDKRRQVNRRLTATRAEHGRAQPCTNKWRLQYRQPQPECWAPVPSAARAPKKYEIVLTFFRFYAID